MVMLSLAMQRESRSLSYRQMSHRNFTPCGKDIFHSDPVGLKNSCQNGSSTSIYRGVSLLPTDATKTVTYSQKETDTKTGLKNTHTCIGKIPYGFC